jgi:hypothetical protein
MSFVIKAGDTSPALVVTLSNDSGVVDLTGATVTFSMRRREETDREAWTENPDVFPSPSGPLVVSSQPATVVSPPSNGQVQYGWASGDTATPGRYIGAFKVTIGGKAATYPSVGFIDIKILPNLN